MKEKIGLSTFYKDNFGSILQCYATKKTIESLGYDCEVLCQNESSIKNSNKFQNKIKMLKFIVTNAFSDSSFIKRWFESRKEKSPLTEQSQKLMDEFVDKNICPIHCSWEQLVEKGKMFKAFIVGSDQVWNAYNDILPIYFLNFAPNEKKFALAVSLGSDKPSKKFLKIIRNGVKGFKKISVREQSAVEIIKTCSDSVIERVGDPTLLFSAKEWKEFCEEVVSEAPHYVLVHFLNRPSDLAINYIKRNYDGLEVVCIAYNYDIYDELGWKFINCGPREYVAYINNATKIFTDSFHTTLFSSNLGKDFYVFDRQYLHGHSQISRITELLLRFELEDRFIRNMNDCVDSDVKAKALLIERERDQILNFLVREVGLT